MSIITISRSSYSKGKQVAEKVAKKLGYKTLAREVVHKASEQFNIPADKLSKALHDSPSILDRFTYSREKYNAFIRLAFLKHIIEDNTVYHGLAGHFFLRGVPNVLKVRVLTSFENRVQEEISRENISEFEARRLLKKDDSDRQKWSQHLYGIDTDDISLYDLVIHIDRLSVDDAVEIIVSNAKLPAFQSNQKSHQILKDLHSAAQIEAILIQNYPTVRVVCKNGIARICCTGSHGTEQMEMATIEELIKDVKNIRKIEFSFEPVLTTD